MKRSMLCFSALVFAGAALSAQDVAPGARRGDLFIAGGTLVDPRAREERPGNLLILDGRIAGFPQRPPPAFEGPILSAEGRWIIPGLHDLHVHALINRAPGRNREIVGAPAVGRRMLYAGVTGFLDLFNAEGYILGVRDRHRRTGSPPVADLFAAGPCLTATDGHCTEYPAPTRAIDTPADAEREIAQLAAKRPDVIKLVYAQGRRPTIDRPTLEAAVRAAAGHGIPSVVHIGTWEDARGAVLAGASAVTHVRGNEPIPEDLPPLAREREVYFIPTLASGCGLPDFAAGRERPDSPLFAALSTEAARAAYGSLDPDGGLLRFLRSECPGRVESVGRLADAGVRLLTGTDSGNTGTLHGFSLHHELALFVEAGLSPWQALAASTTVAGEFLGRSYGISPGDEGSVVLLEASPIADITNTRKIAAVVHHGVTVDRQALAATLFPSFFSREILAVVVAHLKPKHYLLLGAMLLVVVLVARFTVRRAMARRSR